MLAAVFHPREHVDGVWLGWAHVKRQCDLDSAGLCDWRGECGDRDQLREQEEGGLEC